MLLEMRQIVKNFGPVRALDKVDLDVDYAEILGLMGENGAGKSTLMNILAGALSPTSGQIAFEGVIEDHMTTKAAQQKGIRFIHQELNVVNDLTVYENLFLGEEILTPWKILDRKSMTARSRSVFHKMNINIDPHEMVSGLDTSGKQLVEIAKALLFDSKLIIMDEPTTSLTDKEIQNLFTIMRKLKEQGVSIIYISHKMPELFEICDTYTVLRDGRFIERGRFSDINEDRATELLVGRSIEHKMTRRMENSADILYEVKDFSCAPYFSNINFSLKKGEVVAITGLHGDGRGELAEALFGARKCDSGTVMLEGNKVNLSDCRQVMKAGIGMVPRNRKERSILKDLNIKDNISMAAFTTTRNRPFISDKEETARYEKNQKITGIKVDNPNDLITSLSGGNQQKVILGRWLEIDAQVYILDNPTQGIDVGAKFEIYHLIENLAKQGKSIIVFSTEYPEIHKIADRCLVMYKGELNTILSNEELTEVKVMYFATGSNKEGIQ